MDNNLINLEEVEELLSNVKPAELDDENLTEEMKASNRRYEEYIKKHKDEKK